MRVDNLTITPFWTAVIPPFLALIAKLLFTDRDPGAVKRMQRHATLEQEMPAESEAKAQLRALLDIESKNYAERVTAKLNRRINGGNLAAIIFVLVVVAAITYFLILLAQVFWPAGILAGGVAIFGIILILAGGLPNLYKHDTPEEIAARQAKREERKQQKAAAG